MIPPVLVLGGVVALAAAWILLRSMGPRARIGRILAATRMVPVERAAELANEGRAAYIGVLGRIDAAAPWEDENARPLVFRRRRLELRSGNRWTAFEDEREAVPFEVTEGLATIAVDGDALDEGLVVVNRESVGTAADLPQRVPAGTAPTTPARLRVELLTAVDHALVLGSPVLDPQRGPILRPGLGRPLIVTNLERAEAIRLLADGRRGTTRAISLLLGGGAVAVVVGLAWAVVERVR